MHQFYSLCSQIIGGIVVCLLIISFSVTLTLNFRPLYYADIQNLHITELSGREEKDIRSNYDVLIDYNSLFNHQPLKFPTCAMSESGRIHFEEVKKNIRFLWVAFCRNFAVDGCCKSLPFYQKACVALASYCRNTLYCSAGFSCLMVAVNWDYVFVTFHQLVFNNDYWLFDSSTDPIIDILPDGYFMHCAIMIFALVFVGSFLCFIFSHLLKRRSG